MSGDIPKWDNGLKPVETEVERELDFSKPIFSVEFYFTDTVGHAMVNAENEDQALIAAAAIIRGRGQTPMNATQIIVTPLEVLSHGNESGNRCSDEGEAESSHPDRYI